MREYTTAWLQWHPCTARRLAAKTGKESPPLLPSPAYPCTSAANDSMQQVSKRNAENRAGTTTVCNTAHCVVADRALTLVDVNMSLYKKR